MSNFQIHTLETAPEKSKALLNDSIKSFGSIPNLHGVLAGSPGLLEAYKTVGDLFTNSSFDNEEQTVVWQTINVEHECHYCVPAHSMIAEMMKVDPAINEALRNETTLPTEKLEVLRNTTLAIVRNRAVIDESILEKFYAVGYTDSNVLDIILGVSQKVISNYTNHLANTKLDAFAEKFVWEKAK